MGHVQEMVPREGTLASLCYQQGEEGIKDWTPWPLLLCPHHALRQEVRMGGGTGGGGGAVGCLALLRPSGCAQGRVPGWAPGGPGDTATVLAMGPGEGLAQGAASHTLTSGLQAPAPSCERHAAPLT